MKAVGMKKSTCHGKDTLLTGMVEEMLIEALQFGYDASKEEVMTPWFNLIG